MPSSDGGGKAREWTLLIGPGGIGVIPGESPGYEGVERVVVIEKEWADGQLAEALDVIERAVQGQQMGARMEALLVKHGRLAR